jgi:hypothetical protein
VPATSESDEQEGKYLLPNMAIIGYEKKKKTQTGQCGDFMARQPTSKTSGVSGTTRWRYMTILKPFRENLCLRDDRFGQEFGHNLFMQHKQESCNVG